MTFLAINEVWEWCRTRHVPLDANRRPPPMSGPDTLFEFGNGQAVEHEQAVQVARRCIDSLGSWDECLLWITAWGIWPSSEDWPTFYAARGSRGERRSLSDAPGHVFASAEADALETFLTLVIEQGWDAELLIAPNPNVVRRLFLSHDGWVQRA